MENLIVEVSKYLMIILFACYAYECFSAFRSRISTEKRNHIFDRQIFFMYLIHLDAFLVLYTVTDEINLIILYFLQVILVTIVIVNYQLLYPKASRLVTNNMCMLLSIGFIMMGLKGIVVGDIVLLIVWIFHMVYFTFGVKTV